MSTQVAAPNVHPRLALGALLAALALSVGCAQLSGIPRTSHAAAQGGEPPAAQLTRATHLSPVLDTTRAYTTIQAGILVPGRPDVLSRVLDTSAPYLTIQDGTIVPGRAGAASPTLDTTKPYTTVQNGIVVPGRSDVLSPVLDTTRPYTTVQNGVLVVGR